VSASPGPGHGTPLEIRDFTAPEEYRACLELQEETWGPGFSEKVPAAILKVAQRMGGIAAGAWDRQGRLAGFVFGITGLDRDGEPAHWSDMLAVHPAYRDSGVGVALKRHQRKALLARGVRRVYWTFDPLESRNAWLNVGKLGVVCREYVRDMYGEPSSPLHRGLGTDRLVALWLLEAPGKPERSPGGSPPPASVPGITPAFRWQEVGGVPHPGPDSLPHPRPREVLVPIPRDIQELKEREPSVARLWRDRVREALESLLDGGYEVRGFLPGEPVSNYLLLRGDSDQAGS